MNIVHLSNTPLVGAPGKISKQANVAGYKSSSIVLRDYPIKSGLSNRFIDNSILFDKSNYVLMSIINEKIKKADIIHIHNDIHPEMLPIIRKNSGAHFIYQVHSPLREGPLYFERELDIPLEFSKNLVIAQYQTRHYPYYTPVPNLVLFEPRISLRKDNEKLKVIFAPSHSRGGRWNSKYSENLVNTLHSLSKLGLIDLIEIKSPLSPNELYELRISSHAIIDEIVTGSYHQVSLEGLGSGNVVINNSDFFSSYMLSSVSGACTLPPFYSVSEQNVSEKLVELARSPVLTREYQQKSYEFFIKNLRPNQLFERYKEIYEELK